MKQIGHPSLTRLNGKPRACDFIPYPAKIFEARSHVWSRLSGFGRHRTELIWNWVDYQRKTATQRTNL